MRSKSNLCASRLSSAPAARPRSGKGAGDVQSLSLVLARKVALACYPQHIGAVTLYRVPRGWVTAVLRDDPDIKVLETPYDLNEFFHSSIVKTALIPADFPPSPGVVERMCGFCGTEKTIFIEVENE